MKGFFTILFSFYLITTFAQKVDTIIFKYSKYSYAKTEETRKYNRKFIVYKLGYNIIKFYGRDSLYENVFEEVTKEEYDAHINQKEKFANCTPCWQKNYNGKGVLESEGFLYQDCIIGEYRTYNTITGVLELISRYRSVMKEAKYKPKCTVADGDWIYFKPDGSIKKVEKYKDDILVETII